MIADDCDLNGQHIRMVVVGGGGGVIYSYTDVYVHLLSERPQYPIVPNLERTAEHYLY